MVGDPMIISIDGGAGNGKSQFICRLLEQFIDEQFQYTKAILVCGVSVASIDRIASNIMKNKKIGVRYKTHSDPKSAKKLLDEKIVFTTLESAVELSA